MSFQAYLDNVKAKTGKTPEDFAKLATRLGLAKHGEIVKWLKSEHSLGHGHATAIAGVLVRMGAPKLRREERASALFRGNKQHWRAACDSLVSTIRKSAPDVEVKIRATYLSLLRAGKKFAILQPSSPDRLDIGIKLKGAPVDARFEAAGKWNAMVTHRVKVGAENCLDEQVFLWLRRAYGAAGDNPNRKATAASL
ncbi:MAG: DUF4287 domain-containing protein [Steroidobacteraceae bacterium]